MAACDARSPDPDEATDPDVVFGFLADVETGPAHTVNAYRVDAGGTGSRFEMQGALRLDSLYIRLAGPLLQRMEDRIARREVERLTHLLEERP